MKEPGSQAEPAATKGLGMDMVTSSMTAGSGPEMDIAGMGPGSGDGASSGAIGPGMLAVGTGGLTSYNAYS